MWKSLKDKVLLARRLSITEWLTLVEAWNALLGFYLALHWMSYERLKALSSSNIREKPFPPSALVSAAQLHRLVGMAARLHLLPMTCLVRANTLCWMLSRRGIPAQLRIGANKTSYEIHTHAWVEIEGQPVGEAEDIAGRFKVLSPIERA